jgi:glutaminase
MKKKVAKQRFTIQIDKTAIDYFVKMGNDIDMPYHTLINMYLKKCSLEKYKLKKSAFIG